MGTTKCLHRKKRFPAKYGQLQIHFSTFVKYLLLLWIERAASTRHSFRNSLRQGDNCRCLQSN